MWKPQTSSQKRFSPKFPTKYKGDPTKIYFRSSWEKVVMTWLDETSSILTWSSEEIVILYRHPLDNEVHRYFPDFYFEVKQPDGSIKKYIVEVKPLGQTLKPEIPKRKTKRFITEVATYGINQAKWEAAVNYCNNNGMEFKIITERELFGKKNGKPSKTKSR